MTVCQLRIEGKVAWELEDSLPALWPWLFDAGCLTESRRLFTTAFDAAARYQERLQRLRPVPYLFALAAAFEAIAPDTFPRTLDVKPDAILSVDLAELERSRPYRHERAIDCWDSFFAAAEEGNQAAALAAWEEAVLNPFLPRGSKQLDARALSARALELGLGREERASALIVYLFGKPVSRPAVALMHCWLERAQTLPAVGPIKKVPWWRKVLG